MGWNAQPTCAVMMDNVRVPAANLLGEEGQGFHIAMNACNSADATHDARMRCQVGAILSAPFDLHAKKGASYP